MPQTLITGNDGANTLQGGAGGDLIYGYNPDGPQGSVGSISATRVATGLDQPLFAVSPPGDLGRMFLVEKTGAIKILDLATRQVLPQPFLDLTGQIAIEGERGLLGLAFHPDYAQNGTFYVNLILPDGDTEIRRYQVSAADPDRADAASAAPVIIIDQPAHTNHKAGWLGFGPDGYLYAALGDGGGGGDPDNNAQNLDSLLGKMLRLDVNADAFPTNSARNYAAPADNPFVDPAGADEIWALGLRNPWRPGFDRGLGDLFIADVGQNEWEEVNLGQAGANYGWRIYEGEEVYLEGTPSGGTLTAPIHVYEHAGGGSRSITGGYVYRGPAEGLQGDYFFADFITGQVYTLDFDGNSWVPTERTAQIAANAGSIDNPASFAEDGSGNLYVVDFDGEIFRLTPNASSADQADLLRGLGGRDMLFGGSGDDTLEGGDGDDELQGGRGSDRLAGGRGSDRLIGVEGSDTLDGGNGLDTMAGGGGNDLYYVNAAGDKVVEGASGGSDTVRSSITETLDSNVEKLILRGSSDINGTGNTLANTLTGNSGDNVLNGKGGADILKGLGGNDTLIWGTGDAKLDGGGGILDVLKAGTLNLLNVGNAVIVNVEVINMTNTASNTLTLNLNDVLAINTADTLKVLGNLGDTLDIESGWVSGSTSNGIHTYTKMGIALGTLLVDGDVMVI